MIKRKIPYVLQYNADYAACGFWRMLWPQYVINMAGYAHIHNTHLFVRDQIHYSKADVVHIQRQCLPAQYEFFQKLSHMKSRLQFRLIYDADDLMFTEDIPVYNECKEILDRVETREATQKIMELCDEMTVSTRELRDYYLKNTKQKNITVIPNYIPHFYMGQFYSEEMILRNYKKHKNRPKILYSGSPSHFDLRGNTKDQNDDFYHVKDAIIETRNEFCWVFIGAFPPSLAPYIQNGEIEYHQWQSLLTYPKFLSSLELSMAIAPLQDNIFNRCKSDIKFLEASALGLPIACQNISTYNIAPIRFNSGEEMIQKIRETLKSEESLITASRDGRSLIETRWLEGSENMEKFLKVYNLPYGDTHRTNIAKAI